MSMHFKISYSQVHLESVPHHEHCQCQLTITGISSVTTGFIYTASPGPISEQYKDIISRAHPWTPTMDIRNQTNKEESFIRLGLPRNSVMKIIPPPIKTSPIWPDPCLPIPPNRGVDAVLKQADHLYFQYAIPHHYVSLQEMEDNIWSEKIQDPDGPKALMYLSMRRLSGYQWALGKTNGRPHWLPAMLNLYPNKLGKAVLQMARPDIGDLPQPVLKYMEEAIRHLYRIMGVDLQKKFTEPFTLSHLLKAYLGSSNGLQEGERREFTMGKTTIRVSPTGKKIDTLEQDIDGLLEFLRTGKEPPVYWTVSPKSENFFDWTKQLSEEDWQNFKQKMRLFIIPSGIFVLMERLVSTMRHLKERGRVIRIGHRWAHGGADTLAFCLGITEVNAWKKLLVEGDIAKFDQAVHEAFVDAYFNTLLIHHDKQMPYYGVFEQVAKFLLKNILIRVTRLYGELWATIRGQVPSGCFNTSHMDSWIMGLYLTLFCCYQIATALPEDREELETFFLDKFKLIVYGDDFLYFKGEGKAGVYFGGTSFKNFMLRFLGVDVRDLQDGIPFLSTHKGGWLLKRGATFLRHQMVLNPYYKHPEYPEQPRWLPYRESREYMIRAIFSRESRARDSVDILLSVKGLAYATYASNFDAYTRLGILYRELVSSMKKSPDAVEQMMKAKVTEGGIKALRMSGVSEEELMGGFPTWDTLIRKNQVDQVYQDISLAGYNYDPELLVEHDDADDCEWF